MTINEQNIYVNPYDVLAVAEGASAAEITIAFKKAMQKKKYSVKQIAEARKQLMNPQQRLMADFLKPNLPIIQRFKKSDLSILNQPIPIIKLSEDFNIKIDDKNMNKIEQKLAEQLLS